MDSNISQQKILTFTVDSIRLPRFLPSALFITWRAGSLTGKTKSVRANAPLKQIEEKFEIPISNVYEIVFAVQAKSPLGSLFRFGEAKLYVPEKIGDMNSHTDSFTVSSETGDFIVNVIFKLKDIDDKMELDPAYAILLQMPSTITRYSEIVRGIPYSVEKKHAIDYYSDTGLLEQLYGLSKKTPDFETIQEMRNLLPIYSKKISQSEFESNIMKTISEMLMLQYPLFVMADNSIVDGNFARNEQSMKVPLLGLYIVNVFDEFNSQKKYVEGVDVESPIILICDMIGGISAKSKISEQWRIYLISTSLFIMGYIDQHYKDKYMTTYTILEMGMRNAIITFIDAYKSDISPICHFPKRLKSNYNLKKSFFQSFALPDIVFATVLKYLFTIMDFYASSKWLMDSFSENPSKNAESEVYKATMPEYDWPLLTGIDFIVENANDIYNKKIKPKKLNPDLAGQWLRLTLHKLAKEEGSKFVPKKIDGISKKMKNEPCLENIDEWAQAELKFVGKYQLPEKLPELPENILLSIAEFK